VRRRLRALLPRLHLLPPLTTVLTIGPDDAAALAERVAPDGDVLVVDESVDVLEQLRAQTPAPNVFYLLGCAEVLPLPDASVDEVVGAAPNTEARAEFDRVLRP
jgi:ubiquinone/menaquinone biosynthesis C-methylase UbiE